MKIMGNERNGDVVWRASNPGSSKEGVVVTRRPFLATSHDAADGRRYRGGQAIALPTDAITVKYLGEPSLTLTATVARSLMPTIRLGDPIVCELEATGYGVQALHAGAFADAGPAGNQEASVPAEFHPSRIVESLWNL
jgi:hypothetical protein